MAIITIKNIGIIEEGIYKVNSVFSFQQKKHASNFLNGIIVDPKASILRIGKLFGEKNHSNLNKFFTKNWWNEEKLNEKRIIEFINEEDAYALVTDDSNNKKTGKKIKGASYYKRHDGKGFEKAHCKVITGLINSKGEYLPLFTTIYFKKKDAEKEGIAFKTKHEIAREHNQRAKELGIVFFASIYDSWYFNNDMMEFSENKEWIVSQLSGKFKFSCNGKEMKASAFKKTIDKRKMKVLHTNGKRIRYLEFIVSLTNDKTVKIIPFIDEGTSIKILVSTNLNWSAKRIFQEYSKRQSIEVYIRDCKQELHMGDCSFRELKPHVKWDALVMLAYTILKAFTKTKEAIRHGVKTIGIAVDYIREHTKLRSLFLKCKT